MALGEREREIKKVKDKERGGTRDGDKRKKYRENTIRRLEERETEGRGK